MLVMIESPYAGDMLRNIIYARRAMLDSIQRCEAPFAMHLLYPQVLNELDPKERKKGITLGMEWATKADLIAIYLDYGITPGMKEAWFNAFVKNIPTVYRAIGENP